MPTIPFNQVVNIVPGVLAAAGNAVDLNAVVLSQSQYAPQSQVLDFTTQEDVANWFGATSVEASIAATYFQGPDNATATPGMLKFLGYAESAVSGWLLGKSLSAMTIAQLQALSGTLILTAGGTQYTSSTISFAPLTSPTQNAPTTTTTGGSLPATTEYFIKVVATNGNGSTLPSTEQNVTTGAGTTNEITVSWDVVAGATGYQVWFGTTSNAESSYFAVSGGSSTNYTFSTTTGASTGTIPGTNTTAPASFSAAAAQIETAFTAPAFSVTFDSLHQAFLITTTATGATSTLTYCTGTLAAAIGLDSASGGTLSQGADAATPAAAMGWLIDNDQNWASFFTAWQSQQSEMEAFADWASTVAPRYAYIAQDNSTAATTPNNSASFGGYLQANGSAGTLPVYGTELHAAFIASWAASLNFTQKSGRSTLFRRSQSGLAASVSDATTYAAVISNGYNVYAAFGSNNPANNAQWMTPGSISGIWKWADTYFNQIWLNANLQLALVTLMGSVGQLPYNSEGDALIDGACRSPIKAAVNFGAIRAGVQLSASQIQQVINLVGADVSSTLYAQGWYLYSNAAGTASSVRSQRGSPPITLLYVDGESVQSITMPSIVIQ